MLFTSLAFVIYFPTVVALYFLLPHRYRWILLLAASCVFYMALIPSYIFILAALILVDYAAALLIDRFDGRRRRMALGASLIANIGMLAVFKYFNFASANVEGFLRHAGFRTAMPRFAWALPLGLSFHTFQSMSYTIEVYRRRFKAERHLGLYALYVMFFPQLVAGPIERPFHLLPQFRAVHSFDPDRAGSGLRLMMWGFFQKLVVADRLALFVNAAYSSPQRYGGLSLAIATLFFSFQIYCDFAGYTTIAIGAARVLGFDLVKNFDAPYFASSLNDFWHRWHISLSTWFRDYLYIPLGGNRVSRARNALNILLVFALSGAWHGANWTFVVWGLSHGVLLVAERIARKMSALPGGRRWDKLGAALGSLYTFITVTLLWVFFRAGSLRESLEILSRIARSVPDWNAGALFNAIDAFPFPRREFSFSLVAIAGVLAVDACRRRWSLPAWLEARSFAARWALYYGAVLVFLTFARFQSKEFIYFQF